MLEKMISIAESMGIDECSYCKHQDSCNHEPVNCYGGELIYSPCGDSATDWIDAELLKKLIGGESNA